MNKTINLLIVILMTAPAILEGRSILPNGGNARNVIFCPLFAAFALRRLIIHQNLSS